MFRTVSVSIIRSLALDTAIGRRHTSFADCFMTVATESVRQDFITNIEAVKQYCVSVEKNHIDVLPT